MPWFRFYHEWVGDIKVQSMSFAWQRHLVAIFCLHASGELEKFTDAMLAKAFKMKAAELAEMKAEFRQLGFIGEEGWTPKNWEKRQPVSDNVATRMRAYRERKKEDALRNVPVTLRNNDVTRSVVVLDPYLGINSSRELENNNTERVTSPLRNADVTVNSDPSIAGLDALIADAGETWIGNTTVLGAISKFALAYPFAAVEWGTRSAMEKAWKGEKVTINRLRGLIEFARNDGLVWEEKIGRGVGEVRAKARPLTKTEEFRDAADAEIARLKAKEIARWQRGEVEDWEREEYDQWKKDNDNKAKTPG